MTDVKKAGDEELLKFAPAAVYNSSEFSELRSRLAERRLARVLLKRSLDAFVAADKEFGDLIKDLNKFLLVG